MSGAQSWSVEGIDPKVQEAALEAAERQGVSPCANPKRALWNPGAPAAEGQTLPPERRTRARAGLGAPPESEEDEDWQVGAGSRDPDRLAQRIESIERRTQLAVTGLDRAVSTIDLSVLGLAARVKDAEAISGQAAGRVAEALEQFRIAGETLSGRLERAERETVESRQALDGAASEMSDVKQRLEHQVTIAEEIARRAEAAATFLTTEMEHRDAAVAQTLAEARTVAEE